MAPVEPELLLFVLAVAAVASTAQTVAGFGFALIAVPLFVTVLDVPDAVVVTALLATLNSLLVISATRGYMPAMTVGTLLLAAFAGMPLGLVVLLFAPVDVLRIGVALASVAMALALLAGVRFGGPSMAHAGIAGFSSGVLATSTGINGPPAVLYLQDCDLQPTEFRSALAGFFLGSNVINLAILALSSVMERDALFLGVAAMPGVVAGSVVGRRLVGRLQPEAYRRLVLGLLIGGAVAAIVTSLARMMG